MPTLSQGEAITFAELVMQEKRSEGQPITVGTVVDSVISTTPAYYASNVMQVCDWVEGHVNQMEEDSRGVLH